MDWNISPTVSPPIKAHLESARSLVAWLQQHGPRHIESTLKTRIAGAFFSVAFDHHEGVLTLLSQNLKSPAFSLARSVWEAYVRGMWALHVADDSILNRFSTGQYDPKPDTVVKKLKSVPQFVNGAAIHTGNTWRILCDYAHGGPLQIQRWITADTVEAMHTEVEILELLRFTNRVAFLSTVEMVEMARMDATAFNEKTLELNARNWM